MPHHNQHRHDQPITIYTETLLGHLIWSMMHFSHSYYNLTECCVFRDCLAAQKQTKQHQTLLCCMAFLPFCLSFLYCSVSLEINWRSTPQSSLGDKSFFSAKCEMETGETKISIPQHCATSKLNAVLNC